MPNRAEDQSSHGRPGRPRDPQTGEAILAATTELLREVGYRDLTMEGVARRAGVAKTTVYRRWESKSLLVFEAVFTRTESEPPPNTGTFEGDLRVMIARLVEEFSTPEAVATIPGLLADFGGDPMLRAQIQDRFLPPARDYWAGMLTEAIDRGEVRGDATVDASFHVLNGAVFSRIVLGGEIADQAFADELAELVLSGLTLSGA
ncbi:MAG: TetR/AcrR family transcriptional regulator [Gaiellaceae bacterium]